MKKNLLFIFSLSIFTLAACSKQETQESSLSNESNRIAVCEEKSRSLLNTENVVFEWQEESEWWASFIRNWKAIYTKTDWTASEDVECFIDMVDGSVNVEFSNHVFEWVTFYPEDDEDTTSRKWDSYVWNYIMLTDDTCTSYVFDKFNVYYWAYICQQEATEEWLSDYFRSWIYDIFADNWILTCNEANWFQWAWYDENKFWQNNNDKTCEELEIYIEEQLWVEQKTLDYNWNWILKIREDWEIELVVFNENSTDHLLFQNTDLTDYIENPTDEQNLHFEWKVVWEDWAAGNHYYQVKEILNIEIINKI